MDARWGGKIELINYGVDSFLCWVCAHLCFSVFLTLVGFI